MDEAIRAWHDLRDLAPDALPCRPSLKSPHESGALSCSFDSAVRGDGGVITSSADMLETPAETALHQMPSDVTRADSIAQQNASAAAAAGWMRPRAMCTGVQKGMDELTGKRGVMHKKTGVSAMETPVFL